MPLGLPANSVLGRWWADSVAALVIVGLAVREGLKAWGCERESALEVLEGLHDEATRSVSAQSGRIPPSRSTT